MTEEHDSKLFLQAESNPRVEFAIRMHIRMEKHTISFLEKVFSH